MYSVHIVVHRGGLTNPWNDVKLIIDFFVHSSRDDAHFGKGVGHRVDAHLRHEQREQEDLVLLDIMILNTDISLKLK